MSKRSASIKRKTNETDISVSLHLDGSGQAKISTGVGFFDHMLDQIARHGLLDLSVQCKGDLHIDAHHSVEDVGIALGQALRAAVGDAAGITRFGEAIVPLDEALSRSVIDISGRPGCFVHSTIPNARVGDMDVELVEEFFVAFTNHSMVTLHIDTLHGKNSHHIIETIFKSFGRALRQAVSIDSRLQGAVPSTKGSL